MNDLISRKALLAEYDRVHIGEPGQARKLIENAPAVDEPHWATETAYKNGYEQGKKDALAKDNNVPIKWIPASEPPKEDGTYIVKTASGTVTTARFYAFKSFPATKHLPALHRSPQWQSNRNVVKWMPLPEGE